MFSFKISKDLKDLSLKLIQSFLLPLKCFWFKTNQNKKTLLCYSRETSIWLRYQTKHLGWLPLWLQQYHALRRRSTIEQQERGMIHIFSTYLFKSISTRVCLFVCSCLCTAPRPTPNIFNRLCESCQKTSTLGQNKCVNIIIFWKFLKINSRFC